MKRFLIALLALTLILTLPCSALAAGVHAVASPTYVRNGPGLNYTIVDSLPSGSYCEWGGNIFTDSRGVDWYDVYYFNGYGWVSSLHANLAAQGYDGDPLGKSWGGGTLIMPNGNHEVNVRSGPGTGYAKIGTMYPGQSFNYTGYTQNGFYQIEYYGQTGWVSTKWTHKN